MSVARSTITTNFAQLNQDILIGSHWSFKKRSAMDDSTSMTVEFLRARLLSERSVSKSAKQRADELAKKVMELEEQLKAVTTQRKKAEKATVEVLEILENNGIGDFSESFDSNSDQEQALYESKGDNNSMKEKQNAMTSRSSKSEVEELSGSEREVSPTSGRSLSWKRCSNSQKSLEKKKYVELRRQCSFVSVGDSSTKLRVGKSCRKNKHKQTILAADEERNERVLHDAPENGKISGSGNNSDYMNDAPEHGKASGSGNNSDYMNDAPEHGKASGSGNNSDYMNDAPEHGKASGSGNNSDYMNDAPEHGKASGSGNNSDYMNDAPENGKASGSGNNSDYMNDALGNGKASGSGNNSDYMYDAPENEKVSGSGNNSDYMNDAPENEKVSGSGNNSDYMNDAPEIGISSASGNISDYIDDKPEILKANNEERGLLICQGSVEEENDAGPDVNGTQRDSIMERALENQAQHVGRYEAEEKAHREWEEKFKESDSCTLDSCEHGNQPEISQEWEEITVTAEPPDTMSSQGQEVELEGKDTCLVRDAKAETVPNGSQSTICLDIVCSPEQQCSNNPSLEAQTNLVFSFPSQESPVSVPNRNEIQELSEIPRGPTEHQATKRLSLQDYLSQEDGESSSGSQNELQLTIWHEKPNKLEDVLEALQRAKLSLQHELNKSQVSTPACPVVRIKETLPAIEAVDSMMIPNHCSGLFRVPTDFESKAMSQVSFLPTHSESKASVTKNYTNVGVPTGDQCSVSPTMDNGLRDSSLKPYFDPWMDAGMALPPSSKFMYPYADLMPKMPFSDGAPKAFRDFRPEILMGDRTSIRSNHDRSNMHFRH